MSIPTRFAAWWDDFVGVPLRRAADEQRSHLAAGNPRDHSAAIVLVTTAFMLTVQQYAFRSGNALAAAEALAACLPATLGNRAIQWSTAPENSQLVRLTFWAFGQYAVYVVGPLLVLKLLLRRPLVDYGVKFRGLLTAGWAYGGMAIVMFPFVIAASGSSRFLETYPFYHVEPGEPLWPRFIAWQVLYALQFVALEFFFRGFVLHGTRRQFGAYSIYVMMVPYCMIHFGKPPLETIGAIAAGIVLGFMSLKTRSIWLGAALHIFVAWTMDAAALWRTGRL